MVHKKIRINDKHPNKSKCESYIAPFKQLSYTANFRNISKHFSNLINN